MPRSYTTGRRDKNEKRLVNFWRGIGAFVKQMPESAGFDCIVVYRGNTALVEIKDPETFAKKLTEDQAAFLKLTKSEIEFMNEVTTRGGNYHVVWDIETAKKAIGL